MFGGQGFWAVNGLLISPFARLFCCPYLSPLCQYPSPRQHLRLFVLLSFFSPSCHRHPACQHSPGAASTPSSQPVRMSLPPSAPPRHPPVVPILRPPRGRHQIERTQQPPPAAQLPQHPVDRRGPLELSPTRLHSPRCPPNLLASQPNRIDQPRLLIGAHRHALTAVPPLHPPRQTRAELAISVVDQGHPAIRHTPKLH
jgi:hypothetical protein